MTSTRPTLPTGHALGELPPIRKVLHSDERCELYQLASNNELDTVLVLLNCATALKETKDRMSQWWDCQPRNTLVSHRFLDPDVAPRLTCAATLDIRGRRLRDIAFLGASDEELRRLFHSMIDLVQQSAATRMYPDLDSALMWIGAEDGGLSAVLPLDVPPPTEAAQARNLAAAFHRLATGIEPSSPEDQLPPLRRWSKHAGEELERVIARCAFPASQPSALATLRAIGLALGREATSDGSLVNESPEAEQPIHAGPSARGLAKVAGMHALKALLQREVVAPLRDPAPYLRYGLTLPNGILLYGPPGCGKTYIARQLSEDLDHYFVEVIPSEVASPYVHGTVSRIRDLFDSAAEHAPSIIFIDEFEALVPLRSELGGWQQHKSEEVNEFLAQLNGCAEKRILVIAATNQPEKVDPAVRRPGRLDKLIYVGPPDRVAREEMLRHHLQGRPLPSDLNLIAIAEALAGYSASDLRLLVDEAARAAFATDSDITAACLEKAMKRVPPSVTPEIEQQYNSIEQRGT